MDNKYLEKIAAFEGQSDAHLYRRGIQLSKSLSTLDTKDIKSHGSDPSLQRRIARAETRFDRVSKELLDRAMLGDSKGFDHILSSRHESNYFPTPKPNSAPNILSNATTATPASGPGRKFSRAAKLGLAGAGILGAGALGYGAYRHFSQEKSAEVIENRYLCKLAEGPAEPASTPPKVYHIDGNKLSNRQVTEGVTGSFLGSMAGNYAGGLLKKVGPKLGSTGRLAGAVAGGLGGYGFGSRQGGIASLKDQLRSQNFPGS